MSPSPPPVRRFKPEPVESSVRSSKRSHQVTGTADESTQVTPPHESEPSVDSTNMAHAKPRRFLPRPVEEFTRSSHKKNAVDLEQTNLEDSMTPTYSEDPTLPGVPTTKPPPEQRSFAPEPVETSRSSRRKFAPEPVETSSRSRKSKAEDTRPRRRFAPEPVETSAHSSKGKEQPHPSTKPRRRFAPEPIEIQTVSRRRKAPEPENKYEYAGYTAEDGPAGSSEAQQSPSRTSSGGRKFSPELIETAKATYRRSVIAPPVAVKRTKPSSPPPEEETDEVAPIEESRFSAAALAKKHHKEERKDRKQSLMVPELPTIESDSGDDSEAPSLTNSRSSAESELRQNSNRAAGDSYTDYVLRLAAQSSTEKQLQEQAMTAYINERPHEPVAHFAFDDEDDNGPIRVGKLSGEKGVDPRTFRRSSQDDLDWEMQNMRKHHAQLEEAKRQFKHDTAGHSRFSAAALATRRHLEENRQQKKTKMAKAGVEEESEMAKMRAAASPPMQGGDLVFPFTISPKMTRCDTDHPPRPRTNDSDDEDELEGDQNLWNASVRVNHDAPVGLWGGMCQKDEGASSRPRTPIRSGIQTPAIDRPNPFESGTPGRGQRTPGRRKDLTFLALSSATMTEAQGEDVFTSTVDKKLMLERQIEEEFPDRVITQIYNYLSLGYPSLAWGFDEELAKISRIPVEELRKDDEQMDAKGYVGVPEGRGLEEEDVCGGKCRRWEALRLYVREWARQSPGFMDDGTKPWKGERWGGGAGVRRGSWGH